MTTDTLKYIEALIEKGIDREKATAYGSALRDFIKDADFVTKADLKSLESRLVVKLLGGMAALLAIAEFIFK